MPSDEVLYSFKVSKHNSLNIWKWDGHKQPVELYTITNRGRGRCDCFGASRGECKHRRMAKTVLALGLPLSGAFYNYDTNTFYCPADGEGIPLDPTQGGLVDIWSMAIEQGKAI